MPLRTSSISSVILVDSLVERDYVGLDIFGRVCTQSSPR
jgi:hypothetical protein